MARSREMVVSHRDQKVMLVLLIALANAAMLVHAAGTISSVSPNVAPLRAGTVVTVTGSGFDGPAQCASVVCHFDRGNAGAVAVTAAYCSEDTNVVVCDALPVRATLGTVTVEVQNADASYSNADTLDYVTDETVTTVTPTRVAASATQTAVITVDGTGFHDSPHLTCRFGSALTQATWVSTIQVTCPVPAQDVCVLVVEVSNNGQVYTTNDELFAYRAGPLVSGVSPPRGLASGGTRVLVQGENFVEGMFCQFGDETSTPAAYYSSTEIGCVSPAVSTAGPVAVEVSLNDQVFTESRRVFTYMEDVSLSSLSPSCGPEYGGTTVTVSGTNFGSGEQLFCLFGEVMVVARVVASNSIECVAPGHPIGVVDVSVTNTRHFVSTLDTLSFTFTAVPDVTAVVPTMGAARGGTHVTVSTGSAIDLACVSTMRCRFGWEVTDALSHTSTEVVCSAPTGEPGFTPVEVLLNDGSDYTVSGVTYEYKESPTVDGIYPNMGSSGLTVTVSGANFVDPNVRCVWRSGSSATTADGTFVSSSEITCVVPVLAAGAYDLEVSINDEGQAYNEHDYSENYHTFTYVPLPTVVSVEPEWGPTNVPTIIAVTGSGFSAASAAAELSCRFGAAGVVAATYESDTLLFCTAPAYVAGAVALEVGPNRDQFSSNGITFTYIAPASPTTLSADVGMLGGGAMVTVTAAATWDATAVAQNTIRCLFGTVAVEAAPVDATNVLCEVPEQAATGVVTVSFSQNVFTVEPSSLTFTYVDEVLVTGFTPIFGFTGDTIAVTGQNFYDGTIRCRFGAYSAPGTRVDGTNINCVVPDASPVDYFREPLEVSINDGAGYTDDNLYFSYATIPTITTLDADNGPEKGGNVVTVHGTHFLSLDTTYCRFDAKTVPAVFVSTEEVLCTAPSHAAGGTTVDVTNNLLDYSGVLGYTYKDSATVLEISPVLGPERGGTAVTITGKNFGALTTTQCRFGAKIVAATYDSDTQVRCTAPDGTAETAVAVDVDESGVFSDNQVQYSYTTNIALTSLTPTAGITAGGGKVVIEGNHFKNKEGLHCDFAGGGKVAAHWVAATSIHCDIPSNTAGVIALTVTNNDADYSTVSLAFTYVESPTVTSVEPANGPNHGGSLVTVHGTQFSAAADGLGELKCRFYTKVVDADFVDATTVTCTTPTMVTGAANVAISNDATHFSVDLVDFDFREPVTLDTVYPQFGPTDTSTLVTITGANFVGGSAWCKFGTSTPVVATIDSPTQVRCTSPGSGTLAVAEHMLEVTLNYVGQAYNEYDYSESGFIFTVLPEPSITSVYPIAAVREGGTYITLTGTGFRPSPDAVCQYGGADEPVVFVSPTEVLCLTPVSTPGSVVVEYGHNPTAPTTNGHAVEILEEIHVTSLTPETGPIDGGTIVTLSGTNLDQAVPTGASYIQCSFDQIKVPGTAIGSGKVTCVAPAHAAGAVDVEVLLDTQAITADTIQFTYQPVVELVSLEPRTGTTTGATVLTIAGNNFLNTATILCRFGAATTTTATFDSVAQIRCPTPNVGVGVEGAQLVTVSINQYSQSVNTYDYTVSALEYTFYDDAAVTTIAPLVGPNTGDTVITVTGTKFRALSPLACRFDGTTIVPATYESTTELYCTVPADATGLVNVEVTTNQREFFLSPDQFEYQDLVDVISVHPLAGPVSGGTVVTLHGANFHERSDTLGYLFCRFDWLVTAATWTNTTSIKCVAPVHVEGFVAVEVTANAQQYTEHGVQYVYQDLVVITDLWPAYGGEEGGTIITLTGVNFDDSNSPSYSPGRQVCRFGAHSLVVEATTVSSAEAWCEVPALPTGVVAVRYSKTYQGQAYSAYDYSASTIEFEVLPAHTVTSLSPLMGPHIGGTLLTVDGTKFVQTPELRCVIGETMVDAVFVSEVRVTCAAPMHLESGVPTPIGVTLDGMIIVEDSNVEYEVYMAANATAIVPTAGPMSGGSEVVVSGTYFPARAMALDTLLCRFDWIIVAAHAREDAHTIACEAPSHAGGYVAVEVTNNAVDWSSTGVQYEYMEQAHVDYVYPAIVSDLGGTLVTVSGSGFVGEDVYCLFAGVATPVAATGQGEGPGNYTSAEILCEAPVLPVGSATVEVTVNNHGQPYNVFDYTIDGVSVLVHAEPSIDLISAVAGPEFGGTGLFLYGADFYPSALLRCRFDDDVEVSAEWINSNQAYCPTPTYSPGNRTVALSNNGIEYGVSEASFLFQEEANVTALFPNSGPSDGETLVTVTGMAFSTRSAALGMIRCRFNMTEVAADFVSSDTLECVSPASRGGHGFVAVEVTNNLDTYTSDGEQFEYQPRASVEVIDPLTGPATGDTLVAVMGSDFVGNETVACRFGTTLALHTQWLSTAELLCRAPPLPVGAVQLRVGNHEVGQPLNDFEYSAQMLLFSYQPTVEVHDLSVLLGPQHGGTAVVLTTTGLVLSEALRCRFDTTTVAPTWVSPLETICAAPAHVAGRVTVSMSNNMWQFEHLSEQFEYQLELNVTGVLPASGGVVGGSEVTVTGRHFTERSFALNYMACRFGLTESQRTATHKVSSGVNCTAINCTTADVTQWFAVAWIDSEHIVCIAPPHDAGFVSVDVTSNGGEQFTADGVQFEYQEALHVELLTPAVSLASVGGTAVTLTGENFVEESGLRCRFGITPTPVVPTFHSSVEIVCEAPALPAGTVELRVTQNYEAQPYATADHSTPLYFAYHPAPSVSGVSRDVLPREGGALLGVFGAHFAELTDTYCRFGANRLITRARVADSGLLYCTSMGAAPYGYDVEVTINFPGEWTSNGVEVEVQRFMNVTELVPSNGPADGGTHVRVLGDGFYARAHALGQLLCRFGGVVVSPLTWVSEQEIVCVSPSNVEGFLPVEVSGDAGDTYTSDGVQFLSQAYTAASAETHMWPTAGVKTGGTAVTIIGEHFVNTTRLMCRFGATGASLPARFVSSVEVVCVAPANDIGLVTVYVSNNDVGQAFVVDDWLQLGQQFYFFETPHAHSVSARATPTHGGTAVLVSGLDLVDYGALLQCSFNETKMRGELVNDETVLCRLPAHAPSDAAVGVTVGLWPNMLDRADGGPTIVVEVVANVTHVHPTAGTVRGGTRVEVFGTGFSARAAGEGTLQCRFGDKVVGAQYVNATMIVCVAPSSDAVLGHLVQVGVTNDGDYFSVNRVQFEYVVQPNVHTLYPTTGPSSGGTRVTVAGEHIHERDGLRCLFGTQYDALVVPEFLSSGEVVCTSFAMAIGAYAVELTNTHEGQADFVPLDFSTNNFIFHVMEPVRVTADGISLPVMEPDRGSEEGGMGITLRGYHFENAAEAVCAIDTTFVRARYVSSVEVECEVPRHLPEGGRTVSYALNMQDHVASPDTFEYQLQPYVTQVVPKRGTTSGGTRVTVTGGHFDGVAAAADLLQCRFGTVAVPAEFASDTELVCVSPAAADALVSVEVSNDGGYTFSTNGTMFEYMRASNVTYIEPLSGSVQGGVLVTVNGYGFVEGLLRCVFGGELVEPIFLSSVEVWCEAPAQGAQDVALEMVTNFEFQDPTSYDTTQSNMIFAYRPPAVLDALSVVMAPTRGGTLMTLSGHDFSGNDQLYCKFEEVWIEALFTTPTRIVCETPAHAPEVVDVKVSNNNREFYVPLVSGEPALVTLLFQNNVNVTRVEPDNGFLGGGTIVSVYGSNFSPASSELNYIQCRFDQNTVPADYISPNLITCMTPAHAPTIEIQQPHNEANIMVEVTNNLVDFSSNARTYKYKEFKVSHFSPVSGQRSGGTAVRIWGEDFPRADGLFCEFGGVQSGAASFVNSTLIECISPPNEVGSYVVAVTFRTFYTAAIDAAVYTYDEDHFVHSIFPTVGVEFGSTPVIVTGTGFVKRSTLKCRFGDKEVAGVFVNGTSVLCVSPSLPPQKLLVEVANSEDFSSNQQLFEIIQCPLGHYCPDERIINCPEGAFCPQAGMRNYTECPPGTYQPMHSSESCEACPVGFQCPSFGMLAPQVCPAGRMCDLVGTVLANTLCPPGHYCREGTYSSEPTDDPNVEGRPVVCTHGLFCPEGTTSNVTVTNQMNTPQSCFRGYQCFEGEDNAQGSGPCPTGWYCPNNNEYYQCPAGSRCPGEGNIQFLQCTPGWYQDQVGRNVCIPCPYGSSCADPGMVEPVLCPPGFVCNETGLAAPHYLCPRGHFCLEGTTTQDPLANVTTRPLECPSGTFCLEGVQRTGNGTGSDVGDFTAPQPCAAGFYCLEGSTTPRGSGPCPPGHYCPAGTAEPLPVPAGTFASGVGNILPVACFPGSFSGTPGVDECEQCPAGSECPSPGMKTPQQCQPGRYRPRTNATINCLLCPEGTWGDKFGTVSAEACNLCPAGYVCDAPGMRNPYTEGFLCPAGLFCDNGTKPTDLLDEALKCPSGYYCGEGTTPARRWDLLCWAGHYCPAGSRRETMESSVCPSKFYCLEGTESSGAVLVENGLNPIECPPGTVSEAGSKSQYQCTQDQEWLGQHGDKVRDIYPDARVGGADGDDGDIVSSGGARPPIVGLTLSRLTFNFTSLPSKFVSAATVADLINQNSEVAPTEEVVASRAEPLPYDAGGDDDVWRIKVMFIPPGGAPVPRSGVAGRGLVPEWESRLLSVGMTMDEIEQLDDDDFVARLRELPLSEHEHEEILMDMMDVDSRAVAVQGEPIEVEMPPWFVNPLTPKNDTAVFHILSRVPEVAINVTIEIVHGVYVADINSFSNILTIDSVVPRHALLAPDGEEVTDPFTFFTVIYRDEQEMALPLNLPYQNPDKVVPKDNDVGEYERSIMLDFAPPMIEDALFPPQMEGYASRRTPHTPETFWVSGGGDQELEFTVMEYLPYFSMCKGAGAHIPLYWLMENEDTYAGSELPACGLKEASEVNPVKPFSPGAGSAVGDTCDYNVLCYYEENPLDVSSWFLADVGTTLFYFTRDPMNQVGFAVDSEQISSWQGTSKIVQSRVEKPPGAGENQVPSTINLEVAYYQVSPTEKRIIQSRLEFAEYVSVVKEEQSSTDIIENNLRYTLHFVMKPLDYLSVLNLFAFDPVVYIILYVLLAGASILLVMVFWVVVKYRSRQSKEERTKLHFRSYFKVVSVPPVAGFLLASGPSLLGTIGVYSMLADTFDKMSGDYRLSDSDVQEDDNLVFGFRTGRYGFCFLIVGCYMIMQGASLLVPERQGKSAATRVFVPMMWKKSHILYMNFAVMILMLVLLEISHAPTFQANIYLFVAALKILQAALETVLNQSLREKLYIAPSLMAVQLMHFLVTLGAENFVSFVGSYYADLMGDVWARVYLEPFKDKMLRRLPIYKRRLYKWVRNCSPWIAQFIRIPTTAEHFDKREEFLNGLIIESVEFLAILEAPLMLSYIIVFRKELQISELYDIRDTDLQFYLLFTVVVVISETIIDVYINNVMEIMYGWSLFPYLKAKRERFNKRKQRWLGHDKTMLDLTLAPQFRSVDQLSFSVQYYFLVTFMGSGVVLAVFGFEFQLRANYNMFFDKAAFPLFFLTLIMCFGLKRMSLWLGDAFGVWYVRSGKTGKKRKRKRTLRLEEVVDVTTMYLDLARVVRNICGPDCPHYAMSKEVQDVICQDRCHLCRLSDDEYVTSVAKMVEEMVQGTGVEVRAINQDEGEKMVTGYIPEGAVAVEYIPQQWPQELSLGGNLVETRDRNVVMDNQGHAINPDLVRRREAVDDVSATPGADAAGGAVAESPSTPGGAPAGAGVGGPMIWPDELKL